jgi:hypothetical protein
VKGFVDRPKPASRHFVQDRIYEAVKKAARSGKAIPGTELYEIAYKGLKKPAWNGFQKEISRLNQRLEAERRSDTRWIESRSGVVESTAHYQLCDGVVEKVTHYRLYDANDVTPRADRARKRFDAG